MFASERLATKTGVQVYSNSLFAKDISNSSKQVSQAREENMYTKTIDPIGGSNSSKDFCQEQYRTLLWSIFNSPLVSTRIELGCLLGPRV